MNLEQVLEVDEPHGATSDARVEDLNFSRGLKRLSIQSMDPLEVQRLYFDRLK